MSNTPPSLVRAAMAHLAKPGMGDSYFARAEAAITRLEEEAQRLSDMADALAAAVETTQRIREVRVCPDCGREEVGS